MTRRRQSLLHPNARAQRAVFIVAALALLAVIQRLAAAVFLGA